MRTMTNNCTNLYRVYIVSKLVVVIVALQNISVVHCGLAICRFRYGPIPFRFRCDRSVTNANRGSAQFLDNQPGDNLVTSINLETPETTAKRLNGVSTIATSTPSTPANAFIIGAFNNDPYSPEFDAYCFNEEYPIPSLSASEQSSLYLDYKAEFDKILIATNNDVTNDRIPGMFLRMCFHDNAINENEQDFRSYVQSSIDPVTNQWVGETRNMPTSGADASNLICVEEREHPNNNVDNSATRVLASIQNTLKRKYMYMSYADLLHNGCNAATVYLTRKDPAEALASNPFTFGRKDACYADQTCSKKYPLCGPTELLPGVNFDVTTVTEWFTSRGLSECLFMGLMWTHTTVQNMDFLCPIQRLTCTASAADVDNFGNDNIYFDVGDNLDYFDFFLNRGTHQPAGGGGGGGGRGNCDWTVAGNDVNWPMTRIDCTLGISNVEEVGTTPALAEVIRNFVHNATAYVRYDILQCALNVLGGHGTPGVDGNAACKAVIPTECQTIPTNKFGAYYSTVPSSSNAVIRTTVDPKCDVYGYRRRMMVAMDTSSPDSLKSNYGECTDVQYDLSLVTEGAHLAILVQPLNQSSTAKPIRNIPAFCPSIVLHSSYDDEEENPTMEKLLMVLSNDTMKQFGKLDNEDSNMKYRLGTRPLEDILYAFETAHVGRNGLSNIYNPITNNCASFLRNMVDLLNIPVTNNVTQFITTRVTQSRDLSTQHMFQLIRDSPSFTNLIYSNNSNHTGNLSITEEVIISKIVNLYV